MSPLGFFIFFANDVEPTVRLAGDQASGVAYLMGNSTIMERMFRRQPAMLLYAPLPTVIWQNPGGSAYFTFDKPSGQFRSFADPDKPRPALNSTASWPLCSTIWAWQYPMNCSAADPASTDNG